MKYQFKPNAFVKLEVLTDREWRTVHCQYYQVERYLYRFYRESIVRGSEVSLDRLRN